MSLLDVQHIRYMSLDPIHLRLLYYVSRSFNKSLRTTHLLRGMPCFAHVWRTSNKEKRAYNNTRRVHVRFHRAVSLGMHPVSPPIPTASCQYHTRIRARLEEWYVHRTHAMVELHIQFSRGSSLEQLNCKMYSTPEHGYKKDA